jgi:hypothetical protein
MLMSKSDYSNVKLNLRLYIWLAVLGFLATLAGYAAWESRSLPTVATKTIVMHLLPRISLEALQRLPWASEWRHVRGWVQGASPAYSAALDNAFDRSLSAATGGAIGLPALIFALASLGRQKPKRR